MRMKGKKTIHFSCSSGCHCSICSMLRYAKLTKHWLESEPAAFLSFLCHVTHLPQPKAEYQQNTHKSCTLDLEVYA